MSEPLRVKSTRKLINRQTLSHIAQELAVSSTTIHRKLKQFAFKEVFSRFLKGLSIEEFV
ncbi:hypothetical protein I6H73_00900 [Streptococcus dysgalactiae]|nr:hypothetical protein FOB62_03940 [Streptococcus dysgalactiae]QQC56511.1 hypothetical protein I6H73_00900 [Streptococcus dysgalactiae]